MFYSAGASETVLMALVPGHYNLRYKDSIMLSQDGVLPRFLGSINSSMCLSSICKRRLNTDRGTLSSRSALPSQTTTDMSFPQGSWSIKPCPILNSCIAMTKNDWCLVMCSSESNEPLDHGEERKNKEAGTKAEKELESLNAYLCKINKGKKSSEDRVSSSFNHPTNQSNAGTAPLYNQHIRSGKNGWDKYQTSQLSEDHHYDQISDLYLLSILAAINIGVFLFEAASPVKNGDLGLVSLPVLYGAKVNDLIVEGEWWRLVTSMFLHSGIFHLALSCWSLLTFGPQVCRSYGLFTFVLIYVLGGIYGNLTSFLHTPALTIGGTGPIFAMMGAWLIHQVQLKQSVPKHVREGLFEKAKIVTGLSFILSHFGPIDDWAHLGAVLVGIAFGFLTIRVSDSSQETKHEEGISISRQQIDPRVSFTLFLGFILFSVSSLLLYIEGPLGIPETEIKDIAYSLI